MSKTSIPSPKFVTVKLDKLVKAPWNYKSNDEEMMKALVGNMRRNGLIQNLIVRELKTGALEIINGNHRYDAMVLLNIGTCTVCNLGAISEAQAKRIAIETNETRFQNDILILADILREVSKEFDEEDLLGTLPYSEKELEKLLTMDASIPTVQNSPKDDGDTILLKIPVNQEQMEAWIMWKNALGTDNDTQALFKAIQAALVAGKDQKETPPDVTHV